LHALFSPDKIDIPVARIIESSTPLGNQLTEEQKRFFAKNGIIHFPGFISRGTVADIWRALEEVQAEWIANDREKINGVPIKYGNDVDGKRIVQRFAFANQQHPVLAEFLKDPRFDTLLDFVGPQARMGVNEKDGLVVNHYVNTDASKFTQMGWHTDSVRDIFLGKKILPMLNVGIHLDDQDPRNGGLRLLPGTHEQNLWNMLFRKKNFLDNEPDVREVAFDIKAGDLTVHDGRCWHRVERSVLTGDASRRRVMYIPIIAGKYTPKTEKSPTPFYHRFQHLVK
jgi:ectoine hydroxylase-related dioxygenase (phytanoyl-CoA dioxygenase family)